MVEEEESKDDGSSSGRQQQQEQQLRRRFFVGQWLDVKDTVNNWLEATVMDMTSCGEFDYWATASARLFFFAIVGRSSPDLVVCCKQ